MGASSKVARRGHVVLFDVSGLVDRVAVPTPVIHFRDDGVQPLDQGRQLVARIPGAGFLLLERRNHVVLPQEKT